jgi:hypothetical protein
MKRTISKLILIVIMTTKNSKAQQLTKNYPLQKDVLTIDGIIKAFYEVVSGVKQEKKENGKEIYQFIIRMQFTHI